MPRVRLGREVHLPTEVIRKLRLRKGAELEVVISGNFVVIVPPGRIPKDQRYFYTPEWQAKEREADAAIMRGDVIGPFTDAETAIKAVHGAKV